jgi:hypothetical protein
MRFCCFFLFLTIQCVFITHVNAQIDSSKTKSKFENLSFAVDYYQGKMMKIYDKSPIVNNSKFYSLNVLWQTDGSKCWHRSYSLPDIGVSFFYNYLGNDTVLGRSVGICPNIIIKIRGQKRWGAFFKLATGFAYFNKPYNRESNPENLVIGSHITNMTNLCFNAFMKITPQVSVNAGYTVFHFSSGHVSIPNYGFNDLSWNIGLRYKPQKTIFKQYKKDSVDQKGFILNARVSIGYHQLSGTVSPSGGPIYPIYIIAPFISKRIGTVNNLRLGVSAKYFTSYHDFMLSEGFFRGHESINAWVGSVFVGDEWQLGRIAFLFEPSIKLYNPFFQKIYVDNAYESMKFSNQKRWISLKAGLAYYFRNTADKPKYNPSIGLNINTNKTQADYVDISFSCGF